MNRYRKNAFLLPVALAILFILMSLGLTLMMQGQLTHTAVLGENERFIDLVACQEMEARVGSALDGGKVEPGKSLTDSGGLSSVRWAPGESVYLKPAVGWATFANLHPSFEQDRWGSGEPNAKYPSKLPRASFRPITPDPARVPLALEHSFVSIDVKDFRENLVYTDLFPYAAYAPKGKVELEQAISWLNPGYEDQVADEGHGAHYPASGAISALPVKILAKGMIEVEDFPYGSARSAEGPIEVVHGRAFGRTGPLGQEQTYAELLDTQLQTAIKKLSELALDKTSLIVGRILSVETVVKIFKGEIRLDDLWNFVSVEQAMFFPLPAIPTVKVNPLATVLCIHHPFPTDAGIKMGTEVGGQVKPLEDKVQAFDKDLKDKLRPELARKNGELATARQEQSDMRVRVRAGDVKPSDPGPAAADRKVIQAEAAVTTLESQIKTAEAEKAKLQKQIDAVLKDSKELADDLKNGNVGVFGRAPVTELEETTYVAQGRTFGWAYFRFAGNIFQIIIDIVKNIIVGRTDQIADDITKQLLVPTRLFHYSDGLLEFWPANRREYTVDLVTRKRPAALATEQNRKFNCWKGTWNIPPGRALKLRGDWLIEGDLWLRRGSLLYVDGDLTVEEPLVWEDFGERLAVGKNRPTGKIVLEEGAILVVGKDLEVGGDREGGSIVVTSQYGEPNMITSAVLCKGSVDLKYGVHPGVLMDDVLAYLGSKGAPNLERLSNGFEQLMSRAASTLSRFPWIGAFSMRECWFADYCTTFEIVPALVPVGLSGPWPIPLPWGNCLKMPFSILTWIYSPELALGLGEYHMTMAAKIWPWGRGYVPVMLKSDPGIVKDVLQNMNVPNLDQATVDENVKKTLSETLPQFVGTLVKGALFTGLRSLLNPLNGGCEVEDLKHHLHEAKNILTKIWAMREQINQIANIVMTAGFEMKSRIRERILTEFNRGVNSRMPLREIGGVLVYAGEELEIGEAPDTSRSTRPLMACGMFVARHDVKIEAEITVGTVMSLSEDVEAQKLYHFPYFSRASLYRTKLIPTIPEEVVHLELPRGTEPPLAVGRPVYSVTARGWERER